MDLFINLPSVFGFKLLIICKRREEENEEKVKALHEKMKAVGFGSKKMPVSQ